MENYSSKICTKCYSAQEPAARFCDNCGKAVAETAATDGNISIVTKTFLKRQVSETRPLFWLCIIIVGMLGVFGFAQAGLYLAEPSAANAGVSQKPVNFLSTDQTEIIKSPATVVNERPADALDLNESVFEMREDGRESARPAGHKRPLSPKPRQDTAKIATTEPAAPAPLSNKNETVTASKTEVSIEKPAEKPAETANGAKKYVRGPMGGCYYISPSGSKRYVDRGLCG
jgi:hypothetical protein